eukprot:9209908-Pyramimonas_sp.AAC.1
MLFSKDTPLQPLLQLADHGGQGLSHGRQQPAGGPAVPARPDVEGIVAVEVDDVFAVGGAGHQEQMNVLREQRRFGKVQSRMDEKEGGMFNGRHCAQDREYNFHVTMRKLIEERVSPIQLGLSRSGVLELADTRVASIWECQIQSTPAGIEPPDLRGREGNQPAGEAHEGRCRFGHRGVINTFGEADMGFSSGCESSQ